jgi:hypothetical protein
LVIDCSRQNGQPSKLARGIRNDSTQLPWQENNIHMAIMWRGLAGRL